MTARSREKPCNDRPEAVGRMGGRLESVNMMWRPCPFEEAIDSGNRNRYGPRGAQTLFADKRYDVMSDRSGLSPRQIGIIEKIFGAKVVLGDGEIRIGAHSHPVRDGVILLDAEVSAGEALKGDVIRSFGNEWQVFGSLEPEHLREFESYFDVVDLESLNGKTIADLGCGMGRWSKILMDRVKPEFLVCVDLSDAIFVARKNLEGLDNVVFIKADLERLKFPGTKFDFVYSLGVLHRIPAGIETAVANIHGYAERFLCYLYYNLEQQGAGYRFIFEIAAVIRKLLSRIENERARRIISWIIAVLVYKPLAFLSDIMSHVGVERSRMPLSAYSGFSIARIQQDAYDRFFTKVEHRFSREMIRERFSTYWRDIVFSDIQPYWHFLCTGRKGDS